MQSVARTIAHCLMFECLILSQVNISATISSNIQWWLSWLLLCIIWALIISLIYTLVFVCLYGVIVLVIKDIVMITFMCLWFDQWFLTLTIRCFIISSNLKCMDCWSNWQHMISNQCEMHQTSIGELIIWYLTILWK